MTENMADLLRTDAALTALAERRGEAKGDATLGLLASWTAELDSHVPEEPVRIPKVGRQAAAAPSTADAQRRTIAVRASALALALTLSSGGVAAAVGADPLAPLSYVVTKIKTIGQDGDRGTTIFGQGSTGKAQLPGLRVPGQRTPAADRGDVGHDKPATGGQDGDAHPDAPSEQPARDKPSIEANRESSGSSGDAAQGPSGASSAADQVDEPDPAETTPQQPEQTPGSPADHDDKPSKPRRVRAPATAPSPHGPDGPGAEKPPPTPSPQPDTDPTPDPGTPIDPPTDPPPDTPS